MKLGVLLPTFRDDANDAFAVAQEAERSGLDGVFAFDHLWPMGSPERPSLAPFPVLAAISSRCPSLHLGPLVARVGLVGTEKLVDQFETLALLAPGRVIAAIGTGDKLSEAEQLAYDLGYPSADDRRQLVRDAIVALSPSMEVWCGAGAPKTDQLARELGVVINLWGKEASVVRDVAKSGPVSWAGPLNENTAETLDALEGAGATWAVASAPLRVDLLEKWRRAH
ncbi:MAG TPA: LLM class flavin-dependent oxidoreductase [Acidimicrobiales bacterium]|nr:LLM class flavin-dependent oxidoreductase [Acidimicrobiales bacterium]